MAVGSQRFLFAHSWPALPVSMGTELNRSMVQEKVAQGWFL